MVYCIYDMRSYIGIKSGFFKSGILTIPDVKKCWFRNYSIILRTYSIVVLNKLSFASGLKILF